MEIGPTTRTPVLPPVTEPSRAAKPPAEAVRTELPRDKAVGQADASKDTEGAKPEARPAVAGDFIGRNVSLDIETRKVVFQTVDERSGEVVSQFPDPRYLKAYLEQMRAATAADEGVPPLTERLA